MLRELHEVLAELQDSVAPMAAAAAAGMRLSAVELDLPLDVSLRLRAGGCVLLADVPRNHADAQWQLQPSHLHLVLAATPLEEAA
jgi:hypothetical protein